MSTQTPSDEARDLTAVAADLAQRAEVEAEALLLLMDGEGPKEFFQRMVDGGHAQDAVRFLAHNLPPHAAVWWGWGCALQSAGDPVPDALKPCVEATRAWLAEPSEARRVAAGDVAHAVKKPDATTLAALAAFMTAGPPAGPGQPPSPAPPDVAAKLAAGAVTLAALDEDPEAMEAHLARYLNQGLEVARKAGIWGEADPGASG